MLQQNDQACLPRDGAIPMSTSHIDNVDGTNHCGTMGRSEVAKVSRKVDGACSLADNESSYLCWWMTALILSLQRNDA